MNPLIFREYDIRGLADSDLTDEMVFTLGQGFGSYIQEEGHNEALVGRDVRGSSDRIRDGLIQGLLSSGCDVIDLGVVPTPVFYFSFFHYEKFCGLMITASHNPPQYNGFKLTVDRTSLYGESLQGLRRYLEQGRFRQGRGRLSQLHPIPSYIQWLIERLPIRSGLRVAFDPGNGTVGVMLEPLFSRVGVEPFYINLEPDPSFPAHLPDPTVPEYLKELISLVRELDCDLGIGYDGDGDRIGVVDERGQIIFGDRLLGVYAREVLNRHPGAKVIFDVKCSQGLIEYLKGLGGVPVMHRTGHSLIKAKLKEEGAPLAGEMSGHIFFADEYFGYDDAIYASLRLLRILAQSGQPLSSLAAQIPSYPSTPELRLECPDELKFEVVRALAEEFKAQYEVIELDGARVLFSDGWGLVRASNTQPALVLRFEAKTEERLAEIKAIFSECLKRWGLKIEASAVLERR